MDEASFNLDFQINEMDLLDDGDDGLFLTIDASLAEFLANSSVTEIGPEPLEETSKPRTLEESRFRKVSEEEISKMEESHQAVQTRKNTKWAVKIFQGRSRLISVVNFKFIIWIF